MKKITYFLAISIALTSTLTSCDDILEAKTQSSFDESIVFSNYTLAEGCIFSISQTFGETNNYRGRFLPWYGFNTDIEWYNTWSEGETGLTANTQLPRYAAEASNTNMNLDNGPYNKIYEGIERANTCISGLRTYGGNASDMKYLLGEALALRALLYYDLTKAFGDVPARFEPITSETIYEPKSSRDVIYKQILTDLEESFDYLPWPGQTSQTSSVARINKAYAKGLYARICLFASGFAQRPADGKVGTGDLGSVRRSSDSELSQDILYPKALRACEDVIQSGSCNLYSDYEKLWQEQNQYVTDFRGEVLFVIPFSNTRGRWNYTFAINHQNGSTGDQYTKMSGGQAGPVPSHFFDYSEGDIRRDLSCVNYRWSKENPAKQELASIKTWYFGKYRFEWMTTAAAGNDDGCKPVYMRYSDILLMAAECANYLNEMSKAQSYFTQVRARAFGGDEALALNGVDISSKEKMFDAIVDERGFEFVGEFLRKSDLIRWNLLKTKLDEAKNKMMALKNRESVTLNSYSSPVVKDYSYLSGDVYYKTLDDNETIVIYGLDRNEFEAPVGAEWTSSKNYFKNDADDKLPDGKINSIYELDPDTRQFWPIFQTTIINSQGSLVNDYGY